MTLLVVAVGFYLYLDAADVQKPAIPLDPEIIDSIEHPEPDELLAQQMGIASSSHSRQPSSGPLHDPPNFKISSERSREKALAKFLYHPKPVPAPISSYAYANRYGYPPGNTGTYNPSYNGQSSSYGYPSKTAGSYAPAVNSYQNPYVTPSTDTNSDVKPYDVATYQHGPADYAPAVANAPARPAPQYPAFSNPFAFQDVPAHAHLVGPRIEAPINITLKFWYHMRGNNVGRLTLFRKALARPDQIIWEKTGHQSFEWTEAQLSLERGSFQLLFEGTVNPKAPPGGGYIGIDDIYLDREAELPLLRNNPELLYTTSPPATFLKHSNSQIENANYNGHIPVIMTSAHRNSYFNEGPNQQTREDEARAPSTIIQQREPSTVVNQQSHKPETFPVSPTWTMSPEGYQLFPKYSTTKLVPRSTITSTEPPTQRSRLPQPVTVTLNKLPPTQEISISGDVQGDSSTAELSAQNNTVIIRDSAVNYVTKRLETIPPKLLSAFIPQSITTPDSRSRFRDIDMLTLDQTEISAVTQSEGIDKTKLFIIIACCFGAGGLVVFLAFMLKRVSSMRFYSFVPWLFRSSQPQSGSSATASSTSTHRPRQPPPPPPPPPARR